MRSVLTFALIATASTASAATFTTSDGPVEVRNFGYQLQGAPSADGGLRRASLAKATHDLLVIDFARFGDEESKFTPAEISSIKHSDAALDGNGRRKVLVSYISIGEASEFGTFWNRAWTTTGEANSPLSATAPRWLGPTNPDWPEGRKVRYWHSEWQAIIFNAQRTGWLDQIVAQGFDGAYLDIVDAYYFWGVSASSDDRRPGDPTNQGDAARRMMQFIVAMTQHARQTNPHFFVIPQNGEFILNDLEFSSTPQPGDAALKTAYLASIAAIGIEDTYYRGDADENNSLAIDADKVKVLKNDFLAAGKPVLVVDYVNKPAFVVDFVERAHADGFIPYAAPSRELDRLTAP